MNIVYSSSDSYAPIAGVSIMSLLHNNILRYEIVYFHCPISSGVYFVTAVFGEL